MTNRFTRAVFSRYKALRHFSVTFGDFNHQAIESYGYRVPLDDLPVATEAIFTDYDDSEPAMIEFTLESKDKLRLIFPQNNLCYLICEPQSKRVATPSQFNSTWRGMDVEPPGIDSSHEKPVLHMFCLKADT